MDSVCTQNVPVSWKRACIHKEPHGGKCTLWQEPEAAPPSIRARPATPMARAHLTTALSLSWLCDSSSRCWLLWLLPDGFPCAPCTRPARSTLASLPAFPSHCLPYIYMEKAVEKLTGRQPSHLLEPGKLHSPEAGSRSHFPRIWTGLWTDCIHFRRGGICQLKWFEQPTCSGAARS